MSLTLFRGQLPPGGSSVPDPDFSAAQTKDNSQLDAITKPFASQPVRGSRGAPSPYDPKYKMGIGERILGMVGNFASGMRGHGSAVYTGKGALNSQYDFDRQAWQQGLEDAKAQADSDRHLQDVFKPSISPPSPPTPPRPAPSPVTPDEAAPVRYPSTSSPPMFQTRVHRVGDTVHYQGRPHVVQAVNRDGSIHITPAANPSDRLFRT